MKKLFLFLVITMTSLIARAEQEKPIVTLTETSTEVKHVGHNVWFIRHYVKDSASCGNVPKVGCSLMRSEVLEYESFILNKVFTNDHELLTAYLNHRAGKSIPSYEHTYLKSKYGNKYFTRFIDYSDKKISFDMDKREIYSVSEVSTESESSILTLLIILIVFCQGLRLGVAYNKNDFFSFRDLFLLCIAIIGVIYFVILCNVPYTKNIPLEGSFGMFLLIVTIISLMPSSNAKVKTAVAFDFFALLFTLFYVSCIYYFSFGDKLIPITIVIVSALSFILFSFIDGSRQWVIKTKQQFGLWFEEPDWR